MVADPFTCVAFGKEKGVLLQGKPGSGKSTLALLLIQDHGAVLVADDYVNLTSEQGNLMAHTPNQIKGLLEIRHVGVRDFSYLESCRIILVVTLLPEEKCTRIPNVEYLTIKQHKIPHYTMPSKSS
ncbi:MAG: HPr kinase/phosphatase C-terminal domain-containing protein [Cyanobacteria bacterium J06649_11]